MAHGRPMSGARIEWAVDARGGEVRPVTTPSVTDAAGLASATRILASTRGFYNTSAPVEPADIFDRTAAHQFPLNAYSRYLLFEDGAFILEYEGQAFGYGGRFVRNDSIIVFNFTAAIWPGSPPTPSTPTPWRASRVPGASTNRPGATFSRTLR
jgi:hypothetical protein